MPTSNLSVAPFVVNLVETVLPHDQVLDVGPGHGKYAVLLREYLNVKPSRIDALEAWQPYIEGHRLRLLYDEVWHGAAGDEPDTWHPFSHYGRGARAAQAVTARLGRYDMVLMVDVIEHMTEVAARRFLRQLPGARVVICTPVEFFDNGPGLPPTEEHVSHWTADMFHQFGRPLEYIGQEHGAWLVRLGRQQ